MLKLKRIIVYAEKYRNKGVFTFDIREVNLKTFFP